MSGAAARRGPRAAGHRSAPPPAHRVKRLRYAVESVGGLYPNKRVRAFAKALSALQEDLGHRNDVAVATRLSASLAGAGDGRSEAAARAGGLVVGWHARGFADGEKGLLRDFARVAERDPFWDD